MISTTESAVFSTTAAKDVWVYNELLFSLFELIIFVVIAAGEFVVTVLLNLGIWVNVEYILPLAKPREIKSAVLSNFEKKPPLDLEKVYLQSLRKFYRVPYRS